MYGERWKDSPANRSLKLYLFMSEPKDVQLLRNLAPFALPRFKMISIIHLSKGGEEEVNHFLTYSLGKTKELFMNLNDYSQVNASKWIEAIVKALPKVKNGVILGSFSFKKEQVQEIINNSFHLNWLRFEGCKLRKWCFWARYLNLLTIDFIVAV
jgi:hypothetical protein